MKLSEHCVDYSLPDATDAASMSQRLRYWPTRVVLTELHPMEETVLEQKQGRWEVSKISDEALLGKKA
jgi:hypothetical protein